jgi:hypothetical protein
MLRHVWGKINHRVLIHPLNCPEQLQSTLSIKEYVSRIVQERDGSMLVADLPDWEYNESSVRGVEAVYGEMPEERSGNSELMKRQPSSVRTEHMASPLTSTPSEFPLRQHQTSTSHIETSPPPQQTLGRSNGGIYHDATGHTAPPGPPHSRRKPNTEPSPFQNNEPRSNPFLPQSDIRTMTAYRGNPSNPFRLYQAPPSSMPNRPCQIFAAGGNSDGTYRGPATAHTSSPGPLPSRSPPTPEFSPFQSNERWSPAASNQPVNNFPCPLPSTTPFSPGVIMICGNNHTIHITNNHSGNTMATTVTDSVNDSRQDDIHPSNSRH